MDSTVHRGGGIDFYADVEMDGTPVLSRTFTTAQTGSPQTVVSTASTQRIHLYKAIYSAGEAVSGTITLKIGSTTVGAISKPAAGGQYLLMSSNPNYERGSLGDNLTLTGVASISSYVMTDVYEMELENEG